MIRALEFSKITGTPISHHQTQFESNRDWSECNVFTLAWPRQQLHCRINQRVESMFEQGLIEEVETSLTNMVSFRAPRLRRLVIEKSSRD